MRSGTDFQSFYNSLDEVHRDQVDVRCKKEWVHAESILINQDTPSESVFIIESGVVEILVETSDNKRGTPLTYLGPGDIIGELGILNRQPRSATIRAVVDVYYREINRDDFLELLSDLPGFGLYIAQRLAERLASQTSNVAYNSCCVDLSGKIPPFDLSSILFTIEGSSATGELKILDSSRNMLGTFFIRKAILEQARFLHLQGLEAFWQMFLEPNPEGVFSFKRCEEPSRPVDEAFVSDAPLHELLFQAAIKHDHFNNTSQELRKLEASVSRKNIPFEWPEDQTREKAEQVWNLLTTEPQTLQSLWSRSNLSHFTMATILEEFAAAQKIALVKRLPLNP